MCAQVAQELCCVLAPEGAHQPGAQVACHPDHPALQAICRAAFFSFFSRFGFGLRHIEHCEACGMDYDHSSIDEDWIAVVVFREWFEPVKGQLPFVGWVEGQTGALGWNPDGERG